MKAFKIKKNDAGQRLDKFLTKSFPALPPSLAYRFIRTRHIKVNGKRADFSQVLAEGDLLELYIKDEFLLSAKNRLDFLKASAELDLVYEDENLLIANKPAGLLSHPDKNEYRDTLSSRILKYLYESGHYDPEKEMSFTPALVNRLDRNTQGLIIAAKNAACLRFLNHKMRSGEIRRFYLCAVQGSLAKESDTLEDAMIKDRQENKVEIKKSAKAQNKDFKKAKTKYKVLAQVPGQSLLEVELITGRSHQIRVHLANLGNPIIGDIKYGYRPKEKTDKTSPLALLSYKLIFNFSQADPAFQYLKGRVFELDSSDFAAKFTLP
ncbi:MAG: RluA family pseudouridine synthase [Clostridiales bacterium]|nr:RluA family pseudouridine synthase [Clostridiales bacterium]